MARYSAFAEIVARRFWAESGRWAFLRKSYPNLSVVQNPMPTIDGYAERTHHAASRNFGFDGPVASWAAEIGQALHRLKKAADNAQGEMEERRVPRFD